jgi:dolichol-phosphate mannosyltransferase
MQCGNLQIGLQGCNEIKFEIQSLRCLIVSSVSRVAEFLITSQTVFRFLRFCGVGASGVVVNMAALIFLTERLKINYVVSSLLAIELSILSNFVLNNAWTWGDRRTQPLRERFLKYHLVAGFTALTGNWCVLVVLTSLLSVDYRLANLIGIAAGMCLNFLLNHQWTFAAEGEREVIEQSQRPWWPLALGSRRGKMVVLGLVVVALLLRVAAMAGMVLLPEEAYYWMYSQHPDLSYFDHPPMVAWLIWLGTSLLGNVEFGVRFAGALLMIFSSGLLYIYGKLWFSRRAGIIGALLLQVLPAYFGAGLIATMDSALIFFWLVCMVGVSFALKEGKDWGWYVAAFGLGAAMLSKYTGVFAAVGATLALITYRPWRRQFLSPHPYMACVFAFLMFLPVLIWNANHEWASFRFQFTDRFAGQKFSVSKVLEYLGMQVVVATPVVLGVMIWAGARAWKKRQMPAPRWIMAGAFSLPLLFMMGYKSLRYEIHLNWTLPLYLSVLPAAVQLGLVQGRRLRFQTVPWLKATVGTIAICATANILTLIYVLALQPHMQLVSSLRPWKELAKSVEAIEERLEKETGREPLIIGAGKYRLASELAFYRTPFEHSVRASDFTTSQWIAHGAGLGFPYWANEKLWNQSDCVVIDDTNDLQKFAPHFKQFEVADEVQYGKSHYQIAIGRGRRDLPPDNRASEISPAKVTP